MIRIVEGLSALQKCEGIGKMPARRAGSGKVVAQVERKLIQLEDYFPTTKRLFTGCKPASLGRHLLTIPYLDGDNLELMSNAVDRHPYESLLG